MTISITIIGHNEVDHLNELLQLKFHQKAVFLNSRHKYKFIPSF